MNKSFRAGVISALLLAVSWTLWADGIMIPVPTPEIPKPRPLPVKWHHVDIQITDQVAQTAIDQVFINEYAQDLEATYLFPLPEDAAISEFAMFMDGERVTGDVLEREEARRIYEEIVRQMKDPALLEYVSRNLFRASVYPVPAKGEKRIQMEYSEVLKLEGGVCKYVYPLDIEKYSPKPLEEVAISVSIESRIPIKAVYSPTHKIDVHRKDDLHAVVGFEAKDVRPDEDFVLYYTVSQEDFGLSLITHKEAGDDGFFLMLVAPKEEIQQQQIAAKDIVFVFDTSGSMAGGKVRQAQEALRFCVSKLNERDRFNVVTFATDVEIFNEGLVPASAENLQNAQKFINGIEAVGGTNIDAALQTALQMIEGDRPSMVLFLTDGMPTVGEKDEGRIVANAAQQNGGMAEVTTDVNVVGETESGQALVSLELRGAELTDAVEMLAEAGNIAVIIRGDVRGRKIGVQLVNVPVLLALKVIAESAGCRLEQQDDAVILTATEEGRGHSWQTEFEPRPDKRNARIFVFGVGDDVNTHLLDKISGGNGGTSDYVAPQEDIEVKVSSLYTKIAHPVLSDIAIDFGDVSYIYDYYPRDLPDLFKGSQLTLFGRYRRGTDSVRLMGRVGGERRSFVYDASFSEEEDGNQFIPRLWAMRKIGSLLDEIRLHGETQELTDSVVALSTKYGIMTPYTSFLVRERKELVAAQAGERVAGAAPAAAPLGSYAGGYGGRDGAGGYGGYGLPGAAEPAGPVGMPGAVSGKEAVEAAKHLGDLARAEGELDATSSSQPLTVLEGKTLYFDGETWIDNDFDETLRTHEIQYMSDAYFALLNARPDWGKFISLGDQVVFRVGDEIIKIGNEGKETLTQDELAHFGDLGK